MHQISLFELNTLIRQAIDLTFTDSYWLQAELSEVHERHGHCYLEFVQKDTQGNGLIAKARGQVWASRWAMLSPYFMRTTGQRLSLGMQVLVEVQVTFHELYGYALNVIDIDPTYTLGDIARRRQEILRTLQAEGVDRMNKELPLPMLLQRIAVISSPTAAGYEDFCNQLNSNKQKLFFQTRLFPATMQGKEVEQSVIGALNTIAEQVEDWDIVVIIRGGGSTSDLSGFDTLQLAENVAQFPLPVITGIGHERDDTVIDLIAHTRVKTPTAAAEFLIHHQQEQLERVNSLANRIQTAIGYTLQQENTRIRLLTTRLPALVATFQSRELSRLGRLATTLQTAAIQQLANQRNRVELTLHQLQATTQNAIQHQQIALQFAESHIRAADPKNILRLGFSITRVSGKAIRDTTHVHPGDTIQTILYQGTIISTITPSSSQAP